MFVCSNLISKETSVFQVLISHMCGDGIDLALRMHVNKLDISLCVKNLNAQVLLKLDSMGMGFRDKWVESESQHGITRRCVNMIKYMSEILKELMNYYFKKD